MADIHKYAKKTVSGFLPPAFDITENLKSIVLMVQQHLTKNKSENKRLKFTFTPERLIQCSLLLISDTYREFADSWWFRRVINLKLIWFKRGRGLRDFWTKLTSIPVLQWIFSFRAAGPVLRALLIPVIGPPAVFFYLARVFIITTVWEGLIRYLYSVFLIRSAYYMVFLYSPENKIIKKRLSQFSRKKASEYWQAADEFLNPGNWGSKSTDYTKGVLAFQEYLKKINQPPDDIYLGQEQKQPSFHIFRKFAKAFWKSSGRAFSKQIDQYSHPNFAAQFLEAAQIIGKEYYTGNPFLKVCLHDLILCSYFGSLYLLGYIYKTPVSSPLMRAVSVDILIKIKEIAETDAVQYLLKGFKASGKLGSLIFQTRQGFKFLKGGGGGVSLMVSFGPPLVYQYIEDSFIAFLFHRWGRTLIRLFEESKRGIKAKEDLRNYL